MKRLGNLWRRIDRRTQRQIALALAVPGILVCALAVAARLNPAFGRFVLETVGLGFGFVTTPVILESTLFVVGLMIVMAAGILRGRVEGREWDEVHSRLARSDRDGGGVGNGEESLVEEGSRGLPLAVAEGCLEIGDVEEAWKALLQVSRDEWHGKPAALVRMKVAARLQRWTDGDAALGDLGDGQEFAEAAARYQLAHARALMAGAETGEAAHPREAVRLARELVADAIARWDGAAALARSEVGPGVLP